MNVNTAHSVIQCESTRTNSLLLPSLLHMILGHHVISSSIALIVTSVTLEDCSTELQVGGEWGNAINIGKNICYQLQ